MVKIANPIYDVVFKYLLSNNRIAKLLISDLLGVEILTLELRPQEFSADIENKTVTVYRIDFKAEVVLDSGERLVVLIEIQKAKFTADLIRFRKYLGEQYASQQNTIEKAGQTLPLPIITIYFLGYGLDRNKEIPIIRVKRHYLDNYNGDQLQGDELFIETLTHDSIIVQIPALKKQRRNDLEKALSIFEAGNVHEVSVNEEDYPERYRPVIRQLIKAIGDEKIRKTMDIEDEVLEHLQKRERLIAYQQKELQEKAQMIEKKDEMIEEKDEVIEKKNEMIEKKDEVIEKKNEVIEEKDEVIEKKNEVIEEKDEMIKKLQEELNRLKK